MNVTALCEDDGDVVERWVYEPYGAASKLNGSWGTQTTEYDNRVLFTGQRIDPESGLMHYRARAYSVALGRFLQRDPIGIWGDAGNGGNGYGYVGGSVTAHTDPFGRIRFAPVDPVRRKLDDVLRLNTRSLSVWWTVHGSSSSGDECSCEGRILVIGGAAKRIPLGIVGGHPVGPLNIDVPVETNFIVTLGFTCKPESFFTGSPARCQSTADCKRETFGFDYRSKVTCTESDSSPHSDCRLYDIDVDIVQNSPPQRTATQTIQILVCCTWRTTDDEGNECCRAEVYARQSSSVTRFVPGGITPLYTCGSE